MKPTSHLPKGTLRTSSSPVRQTEKPAFKWPAAHAGKTNPNCPRVGDKGEVAYPPFLMAFDQKNEGRLAVQSRVARPDKK